MRGSDFAELKAFAMVVEQGSFTRAAAHLGVTTSTLSATIRRLEERIGVRLLRRATWRRRRSFINRRICCSIPA